LIEVEHLVKSYGQARAVNDISFKVDKGEILGFLGPNGAGKTTTMRVLTGYLPATEGTARIAGFDVFEQSMEVRKRISSQKKEILEGSEEWDVLYRKYYADELRRMGISAAPEERERHHRP